jgi:hypothetical protein
LGAWRRGRHGGHGRTESRGQMLALGGVLLLLGAAETAREMADTEPGGSVLSNLGYAVAEAVSDAYIVVSVALVMDGLIYLLSYLRGRRVTFLEAICNWALVVAAAVVALLMYVE